METGADKMATPQLGSPALTVCFSALLAVSAAIAAGLYCLAVQALSELGLGAASYTDRRWCRARDYWTGEPAVPKAPTSFSDHH